MLHIFSTLGQGARSNRRSLSMRIRYALSAILLRRYENAEIVIRRLEAQYNRKAGAENPEAVQVRALRMAYHYHRALGFLGLGGDGAPADFGKAVDELEGMLRVQPDHLQAVEALAYTAGKNPGLKGRIRGILRGVKKGSGGARGALTSRLSLSLAGLGSGSFEERKRLLRLAIDEDGENGEAMVALMQVMLAEDVPDGVGVVSLGEDALRCLPMGRHGEIYELMGRACIRMKKWMQAVVFLEKALVGGRAGREIHLMLAEA